MTNEMAPMSDCGGVLLVEHTSPKYGPRTAVNAKGSDVTLALAVDMTTRGEVLTHQLAGDKYIGFQINKESDPVAIGRKLFAFLRQHNAKTLNIAGNGMNTFAKHGWTQAEVTRFLGSVLKPVTSHWKLDKIVSGGQTGMDMAGLIFAKYSGIPAVGTFPKGFLQRDEFGIDQTHNKAEIMQQLAYGVTILRQHLEAQSSN